MIDLHCHILPGLDDGPESIDEALALAVALVADGVKHVVATPHVFPGRYDNKRTSIEAQHADFVKLLAEREIPLAISFAGEVRLSPDVLNWLAEGELPFLAGDAARQGKAPKAMLLEMPDGQIPLGADRFCELLLKQGITPVIAHPERNRGVVERPDRIRRFVDAGCQLQLTAASVIGQFGSRAHTTSLFLLDQGWVQIVASDAHNLQGRAPRLGAAHAWLTSHYGIDAANDLTIHGPARVCGLSADLHR